MSVTSQSNMARSERDYARRLEAFGKATQELIRAARALGLTVKITTRRG